MSEAATDAPNSPPIPRTLGRYEVVGVLGRGGMATVYLARHVGEAGFQRLLAIKVLHPHLAHEQEFVTMLLDEARIAARLHHPNLVPIVDLGSEGALHYVVMEYVEGCALSALLSHYRNERPPRLLVPIFLDTLTGLHAAHTLTDEAGVPLNLVHRDVSPQNILVGVDAIARVTDFGIARAEARINSTRPGQMKGKIAFMSPEQIRDSSHIDFRSDIFAVGALLWSALTGRRLFRGSSDAATLSNILNMVIPAPSSIGLQPPPVFDAICLRALDRDPGKRFSSALEMEEALREAAMTSGLLGSKREIAQWVGAAFDEELSERRNAIRTAISHVAARREAMQSVSGFRVIPSVGSETPPDAQTPPELRPSPSQAPTISTTMPVAKRSRTPWIAAGAALAACAAMAGLFFLRGAPRAANTASSPAASAAPQAKDAPAKAPAPEPTQAPAPSAAAPAQSAAKAAASATAASPAKPAKRVVVVVRRARHKAKPAPPPKTTAAPPPQPQKKARAWDNDSPLPPQ